MAASVGHSEGEERDKDEGGEGVREKICKQQRRKRTLLSLSFLEILFIICLFVYVLGEGG